MPNPKVKKTAYRKSINIKTAASSSDETSAKQVMDSLFGLFEDLGVNISKPPVENKSAPKDKTPARTMYAYASAIGEMLTYWHQNPAYLDEHGNPAKIKFAGKGPSFTKLARLKAPSLDVSYLLRELERIGAVSRDESKHITVHIRSLPVYEDKRIAMEHTLTALHGFIKTLRHNLGSSPSNSDQLFHRIAWTNDFDTREVQALKVRIKRHGQNFLESFDDWLMRKALSKKPKIKSGAKRSKVAIGIYLSIEQK